MQDQDTQQITPHTTSGPCWITNEVCTSLLLLHQFRALLLRLGAQPPLGRNLLALAVPIYKEVGVLRNASLMTRGAAWGF